MGPAQHTKVYRRYYTLPHFDGDESRYLIWEARFLAYVKTLDQKDTILRMDPAEPNTPEAVEVGKKNKLAYD